ncbi:MAG: solute:sodium symporter family transporter [Cellvibrionales bacterium TMED148]|nr:solute:sodium symporter family transporter [Porticoccaceae bacterium]RPG88319.1 MAG: solute:sodium symporter family transporter [Cellvibrionales bacterium TMED148]
MTQFELGITLLSMTFFMLLVGWISYRLTKGTVLSRDGYFLAGRGLNAWFIAGSLLLTNLSAEQLIGLNGSAYGYNLSSMAWEVTAAFSTICMAFFFLPRYLAGGFTTLPQFLSDRFDDDVRKLSVILFMLGYGLVTIPSVLYSGSIAVLQLFNVPKLLNLSYEYSIFFTIFIIGGVGSVYAVFGGLRAVVVSDTLNGIGLLIIGLTVPVLGLSLLGEGSTAAGLRIVLNENTDKLNAIGSTSDPTPFATVFTGMIFANLFYWCSNQYVIQRTLGAKSLAEGQKGVLFSGFFKVLVPFLMMFPGLIAFHLYGPKAPGAGLASIDSAYPQLVADVLPVYAMGFFLAVLLGAVFSSFNSLLNSAATLFCLDIYLPYKNRHGRTPVSDFEVIRTAKYASLAIALLSFLVAPLLQYAPEGLWQVIRIFTGFYNIPVIAIVLVGFFARQVPALGPKLIIGFHIIAYGLLKFVFHDFVDLHFLHLYAILFVIEIGMMLLIGRLYPREDFSNYDLNQRDVLLQSWRFAIPCSLSLGSLVIALYVLLSPIGLVGGNDIFFWPINIGLILLNLLVWLVFFKRHSWV